MRSRLSPLLAFLKLSFPFSQLVIERIFLSMHKNIFLSMHKYTGEPRTHADTQPSSRRGRAPPWGAPIMIMNGVH